MILDEATLYLNEMKLAMDWLGNKKKVYFIGQTVEYEGSPTFKSLRDVPPKKKIEMPVAENMQMGISLGMAIEGLMPVSVFPRMDFLICGTDQLVNHINHCEEMSNGIFKPGIIIRTGIGNTYPLYPGVQHCSDYTEALKLMCPNIKIVKLETSKDVVKEYQAAYRRAKEGITTILIELPLGGVNPNAYRK